MYNVGFSKAKTPTTSSRREIKVKLKRTSKENKKKRLKFYLIEIKDALRY
jgi:hypothetical protein